MGCVWQKKIAGKFLTGHVVGLSRLLFAFGLKIQLFRIWWENYIIPPFFIFIFLP